MDLHELAQRVVRIETKVDASLAELRKINGRIVSLEGWRHEATVRDAVEAAREQERDKYLMSKRSIVQAIALFAAIAATIDVAVRLVFG